MKALLRVLGANATSPLNTGSDVAAILSYLHWFSVEVNGGSARFGCEVARLFSVEVASELFHAKRLERQ